MKFLIVFCFLIIQYTFAFNVTKTIRLNSGTDCPIVGLGTGGHKAGGAPLNEVVKQMVRDAIELGYRHIDTASSYGNEKEIGETLNELMSEGKVKREDIFLTTKIFGRREQMEKKGRTEALNGVRMALHKLNLTYIDLMLIHSPASDPHDNSALWSGLEDALSKKLVKSIGVSNFGVKQLESLINGSKVVPAMNQIESHPQLSQSELIEYCGKHGIHVTAYSPLGAGTLITNPTLVGIGKKHNKTSAQVMIRWQIQRGIVAIPKSTKKAYLKENLNVFDFSLTDNEMKVLEDMK